MKRFAPSLLCIISTILFLAAGCANGVRGFSSDWSETIRVLETEKMSVWENSFTFDYDTGVLTVGKSDDGYGWWGGALGAFDSDTGIQIQGASYDLSMVEHVTFCYELDRYISKMFLMAGDSVTYMNGITNEVWLSEEQRSPGVHKVDIFGKKINKSSNSVILLGFGGSGKDIGVRIKFTDLIFYDEWGNELELTMHQIEEPPVDVLPDDKLLDWHNIKGISQQIWEGSCEFDFESDILTIGTSRDGWNWWGMALGTFKRDESEFIGASYDLSNVDHLTFTFIPDNDLTELFFRVGDPIGEIDNDTNKTTFSAEELKEGVHNITIPAEKINRSEHVERLFAMSGSGNDKGTKVKITDIAFWDADGKEVILTLNTQN